MIQPLPKWIMKRYAILWNKFRGKDFNFQKIAHFLKENEGRISVMLSDLKKYGWLEVNLDQKDSRKRLYRLKSPEEAIRGVSKNGL